MFAFPQFGFHAVQPRDMTQRLSESKSDALLFLTRLMLHTPTISLQMSSK